ncbi:MAG: hypothetical protein GY778_22055, partial [bacterium]|nr:hypothetical protein [bacterium]
AAHANLFLHQDTHKSYAIWDGDSPVDGADGQRAGHFVAVTGDTFGVTTSVRWMWQNHPSGLEWIRGDQLRLHFWTQRGKSDLDLRPRQYLHSRGRWETGVPASKPGAGFKEYFLKQGPGYRPPDIAHPGNAPENACPMWSTTPGVPDPGPFVPNTKTLKAGCTEGHLRTAGEGVAKTQELLIDFYPAADATAAPERAHLLQKPVIAFADPAYARDTRVAGRLHPYDPVRFAAAERMAEHHIDRYYKEQADDADIAAGAYGDRFGVFDFGDTLGTSSAPNRHWAHAFYVTPSLFWQQFRRGAGRKWFEYGEANSRYVMDVDVTHPGGPDGAGGNRNETRTNWLNVNLTQAIGGYAKDESGLLHWAGHTAILSHTQHVIPYLVSYYELTGYERAKETANLIGRQYQRAWENRCRYPTWLPPGQAAHCAAIDRPVETACDFNYRGTPTALWMANELYRLGDENGDRDEWYACAAGVLAAQVVRNVHGENGMTSYVGRQSHP